MSSPFPSSTTWIALNLVSSFCGTTQAIHHQTGKTTADIVFEKPGAAKVRLLRFSLGPA